MLGELRSSSTALPKGLVARRRSTSSRGRCARPTARSAPPRSPSSAGLSRVTARRYLEHLVAQHAVELELTLRRRAGRSTGTAGPAANLDRDARLPRRLPDPRRRPRPHRRAARAPARDGRDRGGHRGRRGLRERGVHAGERRRRADRDDLRDGPPVRDRRRRRALEGGRGRAGRRRARDAPTPRRSRSPSSPARRAATRPRRSSTRPSRRPAGRSPRR